MIEIIAGTDRQDSFSSKIARMLVEDYRELKAPVGLIDLSELDFHDAVGVNYRGAKGTFLTAVDRISKADGVVLVVPEYNGSFPGALKLFIDHWRYPETFENRAFAFVGIGTRWGGLRPVEHLQQVLGFRNGYCFPHRVFIPHVNKVYKDGKIEEPIMADLLKVQARDFLKFVRALKSEGLDAASRLKK